jgi:hypothetical protein
MTRTGKSVAAVTGLLVLFLVVLSFVWNGWAAEFALLVAVISLVALALVLFGVSNPSDDLTTVP